MADADGIAAESAPKPGLLDKNEAGYQAESAAWEKDALNRKPAAAYLTRLVASIRRPFVVSVDAPYGGGKTYFLKNWKRDLDSAGYLTVYFNAWETDYSEDPLLPFMAAISRQLEDMKETDSSVIGETVLKKIRKRGPELIAKTAGFAAKNLIRRVLGDDGLEAVKDALDKDAENELSKKLGGAMENVLRQRSEDVDAMADFREQLESTIKELTRELPAHRQKLIVFVDELDRCRPDYAVKVLERIKHFFAVPGMVVILGIAEKQVAHAMSAVYGAKLDTKEYLRRFIDWRFQLPKPSSVEYARFLADRFGLSELKGVWKGPSPYESLESLLSSLGTMSEALGLSLRQQEQIFTEINLYLRTLEGKSPLSCVVGILAPLRAARRDVFDAAFVPQPLERGGSAELQKLLNFVKSRLKEVDYREWISSWPNWKGETVDGIFHSWFVTEQMLNKTRSARARARQGEALFIHGNLSLDDGLSPADMVRQRLDNAGKFLPD